MKKQLLSIGLSLAMLGGSAVTAMPAFAATSTSTTTKTISKQQAQKEITQLQTANKKLEAQVKRYELEKADSKVNIADKNDKRAYKEYNRYRSEKTRADYEKCEVNGIKQVTAKVNAQASKGKISKSYANKIAQKYKSDLVRAQKNADRATARAKSYLVVSKHFESLGKTWKVERFFHEKYDRRKIVNQENCLRNESRAYSRLTSSSIGGSAKEKKVVKAIADDYRKNQYRATKYNIDKAEYDLFFATIAQNTVINHLQNITKEKISANKKKIAQLQSVK